MTRTDSLVVGTLVALLALIASLVSVPSLLPTAASSLRRPARPMRPIARPYREGVLGRPGLGQPVECPHPGRPRPRRAGLRRARPQRPVRVARAGPRRALVGRLDRGGAGRSSSVTTRAGTTASRSPPRTSRSPSVSSRTPTTTGPGAGSWNEVTVATEGLHDRRVHAQDPARWLPPGGDPADRPGPHPGRDPGRPARRPVVRSPADRVRAVRGREPERRRRRARSRPARSFRPTTRATRRRRVATDSLATPGPASRPARPVPYLTGMEFRFFDDPEKLAAAYREGSLDAASGLSPGMTRDLGDAADSRVLRYPGSTLTAVLLNLRPGHPEFANPAVRTALLAAIDRPRGRHRGVRHRPPAPRPGVIPPSSFLFDRTADPPVPYDPAAAQMALAKAGWTNGPDGWRLPKAKSAAQDRAAQPRPGVQPGGLPRPPRSWPATGRRSG